MEIFDEVAVMFLYLTLLFLPRNFAVFDGGGELQLWVLKSRYEILALLNQIK